MKKNELTLVPIPTLEARRIVRKDDNDRRLFAAWTGRTPEEWMERFEAGEIQLFEPHGMTILKMCYKLLASSD